MRERQVFGTPGEEAKNLTCHEYFTLARPANWQCDLDDLFASEPVGVSEREIRDAN